MEFIQGLKIIVGKMPEYSEFKGEFIVPTSKKLVELIIKSGRPHPPVSRSIGGDIAQTNRPVLTLELNKKRLAFSNESRSTALKSESISLDGNQLKSWASGGDEIPARGHCQGERNVVVNAICIYAFNKQPTCNPSDALERAKYLETSFKFDDKLTESDPFLRKSDPNIKKWISENHD